jgi:F-type H+-transporting ATPase subunit delta
MKDQNTAKVYAKALIEIAKEKNIKIAEEILTLTEVINSSNDLENILFLDVFTNDEKIAVIGDIAKAIKLSREVSESLNFLIQEKRINLLPLISKEIIVMDDEEKGFLNGMIQGSTDTISDEEKAKLVNEMKKFVGNKEMKFKYEKNEELTAGYRLTVNDMQLDATVDTQLEKFKNSVLSE